MPRVKCSGECCENFRRGPRCASCCAVTRFTNVWVNFAQFRRQGSAVPLQLPHASNGRSISPAAYHLSVTCILVTCSGAGAGSPSSSTLSLSFLLSSSLWFSWAPSTFVRSIACARHLCFPRQSHIFTLKTILQTNRHSPVLVTSLRPRNEAFQNLPSISHFKP